MIYPRRLNDLFPTEVRKEEQVDARALHTFLEVRGGFNSWIQTRINELGYQEGEDYRITKENVQEIEESEIEYALSLEMAQNLAIVQNTEIGKMVRNYLIDREQAYIDSDPKLLGGYSHILRMATGRFRKSNDDSIS